MRYWEHPDWPAMAAAVREAGAWGPAADWIEEVGGDDIAASRVRTLAQADSSHPVWWAAAKVLADGWGADLTSGVGHRKVEVMEAQRMVRVGELYLAFKGGFVHRVAATGRHLHALNQICRREPVAEVLVCGPLWLERDGPQVSGLSSDRELGQVTRFRFDARLPGWEGGGFTLSQVLAVSEREWQADPRAFQDRRWAAEREFLRRCRPESLLAEPLVPPGPRVEWARQAGDGFYRPHPPGTGPFFPEEREAVRLWDRIARWHANHPDGGRSLIEDYGGYGQGATTSNSPYTLYGVALGHTTVRS